MFYYFSKYAVSAVKLTHLERAGGVGQLRGTTWGGVVFEMPTLIQRLHPFGFQI